MPNNEELYHYGIKGQKWGVRRYQYEDGTRTPAGKKRYADDSSDNTFKKTAKLMNMKVSELTGRVKTQATGRQYVDTYLKKGTTFARIQTTNNFENFAFYATYKKKDMDKYLGLFGKNLTTTNIKGDVDEVNKIADKTSQLANDIAAKTAYINMSMDETGAPCIELGKSDNEFKLRITNTSIDFMQGSQKIAYITNQSLYIQSSVVTDEMQIGEGTGFIWKKRSNGNMGLRYIG